jgi:hypothetical protein
MSAAKNREEAMSNDKQQPTTDDLLNRFKEQVEAVPEEPADNPAGPDSEPDPEAAAEQQDDIDPTSIPDPEPDSGQHQTDDQKLKSCRQLVKLGDQGQQALFSYLYRKAYFTDRQWERITEADIPKTEASKLEAQEDIQLKQRYTEYQQQLNSLPLDQEEEADLTEHLKAAMDYLEKQPPSPVTAAAIAIISTLGARAVPLLTMNN